MLGPTFPEYLQRQWSHIEPLLGEQVLLIVVAVALSALIGVSIGALVWDRSRLADAAVAVAGALLTVPSLALLTLFIPVFGLGWKPTLVALVLYAQLPILRNTVTGLQSIDPGVLESATGIGMARWPRMLRIQLPLAWPVILAGLRVATVLMFGISAIAAYVSGPGLGNLVFTGLSRFGAVNSTNQALAGSLGIALLALAFDAGYLVLRRFTTSRGLRG